jgi:hypothetical protein
MHFAKRVRIASNKITWQPGTIINNHFLKVREMNVKKISPHRSSTVFIAVLLFSAVLLASASTARAVLYTSYTIIDYPQPDSVHEGFMDHFTGTITIPASMNNATYTTIPSEMSITFEITGAGGTFTTPLISPITSSDMNIPYPNSFSGIRFTPTSVILPVGGSLALYSKDNTNTTMNFFWYNLTSSIYPYYHSLSAASANQSYDGGHPIFTRSDVGLPSMGQEMMIATNVPEPATLVLLSIAMIMMFLRKWRDNYNKTVC